MKPDKHKKKKSEQYMKKHNGSSAGGSRGEEVHEQHKQDRTSAMYGKGQRIESQISESHRSASTGFQKSENLSDAVIDSTKYNRRKIESNWQKYEIDSGYGEEITMRGADYSELVQFNKYVSPEFQFENFIDTSCDAAASEEIDEFSKHVSIDCEMLSFALRCVPLCQRLDIDESLFDESELEAFKKDASDQLKSYQAFLESRNVSIGCGNVSYTVVTGMNTVTLQDPGVSSCTTKTADCLRTDELMPSADVICGSEINRFSQSQTEAVEQVSVETNSLPEPTEGSAISDSHCKQPDLTVHPRELSNGSKKPEKTSEVSAVAETNAKPTSICTSVKDLSSHSVSLAELEDELDSLLEFDRTLPAPLCVHG